MTWFDEENEEEEEGENEKGEFHIQAPETWEEPMIGIDLPPEPPDPPEMEHSLDPEDAIQRSKQRIEEMVASQRTETQNGLSDLVQPSPDQYPENTSLGDDSPPAQPVEEQVHENGDRDSLDELDRRMNLVENTVDTEPEQPDPEPENTGESSSSDQELVDQILEIHSDITRATEHTESLEHTLNRLNTVLQQQGIEIIEPNPGDTLDSYRHRVIETIDSPHPEGTIAELVHPGYENAEYILEEALVKTSTGGSES